MVKIQLFYLGERFIKGNKYNIRILFDLYAQKV